MEGTLDIRQVFGSLRKHIVFILLTMFGFTILAFGVTKLVMTPKYTSVTQILVNQKKDANSGLAYQNQQADVQMISTYKDIITNQVILNQVTKELAKGTKITGHLEKYQVNVAELKSAISISNKQNSQVFALSVQSTSPNKSAAIANSVASVFRTKIKKMMSVNNVTIVSRATPVYKKTSPRTTLITLVGLLIGLILGIAIAMLTEITDTTVKDDDFLTSTLGLTNLGHVARIKMSGAEIAQRRGADHRKKQSHRVRV